jgi:putative heme-binding domain-containing protein
MLKTFVLLACAGMFAFQPVVVGQQSDPILPQLIKILRETGDAQLQLDILRGVTDAVKGRRNVEMPAGWAEAEKQLAGSKNNDIRMLAQGLGLTFGSSEALKQLREIVLNKNAEIANRRAALDALMTTRDTTLPPLLQTLVKDNALRPQALRGLAAFEHAQTPGAILETYGDLNTAEKRDALNTLASRAVYAEALLDAVERGKVPRTDLTADVIRQLRNLKVADLNKKIEKVWGALRETAADKAKEVERYKKLYWAGGSQPGDAIRGRVVFAKVCQQCHTLYETGGKVGPDLTGSNRADLDYILENMMDPNAVIPNDYRSSTVETKDDRVLTGIVKSENANSITILTANESVTLPRNEVASVRLSDISMMPEGLLAPLNDQEVRDLIYYLSRPGQVPLLATADTVGNFFNLKDLTGWEGTEGLWSVDNGEIIGKSTSGLKKNEFLKSQMTVGDFRLICEVKLTPNKENSGIQFRTDPLPSGEVKGYQADAGAGWWGKLYEEEGRGLLWDKSGEQFVKQDDWNVYEIVAVGHKIKTAINGKACVDLEDPKGALQGIIAFQLHAGGPMEVRYRNLRLEVNPQLELATARR